MRTAVFYALVMTAVLMSVAGPSFSSEGPALTLESAQRAATICLANAGQLTAPATIIAHDNVLCLTGDITPDTLVPMKTARPGSILVVNSGGGDVAAALDIADAMTQLGTSIVVSGLCLSSCANYLFVAATEKVVLSGSFVGFHGAPEYATRISYQYKGLVPTETQRAADVKRAEAYRRAIADRQTAFFKRLSVDPALVSTPPPALPYDHTRWSHLFWEYGPRALGGFGVTGIRYFATPDTQGLWGWFTALWHGIHCEPDGADAWLCSS